MANCWLRWLWHTDVKSKIEKKNYYKFIYSEKATKILRNLPLTFDRMYCSQKISQNFVAFSEYMNFI